MPMNKPATDVIKERKLKKKLASTTWMTMSKGPRKPNRTKKKPIRMIFNGRCRVIGKANKLSGGRAPTRNTAALARRTSPVSRGSSAGGIDIPEGA